MHSLSELTRLLGQAGVRIAADEQVADDFVPPVVAAHAVDGAQVAGRVSALVDIDDPLILEKANADWYRLSVEEGLFRESDRRFLVAVQLDEEESGQWVHAELADPWDIMGKGASGPLGSAYCRPGFVMLSCDGNVISCGSTWQAAIGTVVLKDPRGSDVLVNLAHGVVRSRFSHPKDQQAARRWLGLSERAE
jgi:hypothetical protein